MIQEFSLQFSYSQLVNNLTFFFLISACLKFLKNFVFRRSFVWFIQKHANAKHCRYPIFKQQIIVQRTYNDV